jgi:1-acyl-sn-glycerol-3-phosphate acyltransferase
LIKRLRSIWIWGASASLILLWTPAVTAVWLFDRDPCRRRTGRAFRSLGRVLGWVNPWRIHISGAENKKPGQVYVVVSNHQSMADIPLISHLVNDSKWLSKAELFRFPVVGWMMRMAGDIPVERSDRRKGAQAMLRCARYLRQGCSVMFFPEGTRSKDGEMLPFNDGPFQLAIREQVPVLPLVVEGSGAALPRNTWIFGPAQDIHLRALEPVSVEGWDVKQSGALRDLVRQKMADELSRPRGTVQDTPA